MTAETFLDGRVTLHAGDSRDVLKTSRAADAMVVYTDRGISDGMKAGINTATFNRIPIEYRVLPDERIPEPAPPEDVRGTSMRGAA